MNKNGIVGTQNGIASDTQRWLIIFLAIWHSHVDVESRRLPSQTDLAMEIHHMFAFFREEEEEGEEEW